MKLGVDLSTVTHIQISNTIFKIENSYSLHSYFECVKSHARRSICNSFKEDDIGKYVGDDHSALISAKRHDMSKIAL